MNEYQKLELNRLLIKAIETRTEKELALGFLRYEALRGLNARQYQDLCDRNRNGEFFDEMVDALALERGRP